MNRNNNNNMEATNTRAPLDLVCKNRLHPSARTFDVQMGADHSLLPSIATLVDGGSHVWFGHRPQVWTVHDEPPQSGFHEANSLQISPLPNSGESEPHAIRFAPSDCQNPNNYAFATICSTFEPQKSVVRLWVGNEDRIGHGNYFLPFNVNDVAFDPRDAHQLRKTCVCV